MGIGLDLMWNDDKVSTEDKLAITKAFVEGSPTISIKDEAVRQELTAILKIVREMKHGAGATSTYVQGRWDMVGEFEDMILKRLKDRSDENQRVN